MIANAGYAEAYRLWLTWGRSRPLGWDVLVICNVCFDPCLGGNVSLAHNAAHFGVTKAQRVCVIKQLKRGIEKPCPSKARCISFQENFVRWGMFNIVLCMIDWRDVF